MNKFALRADTAVRAPRARAILICAICAICGSLWAQPQAIRGGSGGGVLVTVTDTNSVAVTGAGFAALNQTYAKVAATMYVANGFSLSNSGSFFSFYYTAGSGSPEVYRGGGSLVLVNYSGVGAYGTNPVPTLTWGLKRVPGPISLGPGAMSLLNLDATATNTAPATNTITVWLPVTINGTNYFIPLAK